MIQALAAGDRQSFMKVVAEDPKLLNARGPEGSTPFMYAVLYSDAATLRELLQKGADPKHAQRCECNGADMGGHRSGKNAIARGSGSRCGMFDPVTPELLSSSLRQAWRGADCEAFAGSRCRRKGPRANPVETPLTEAAFAADAESMQLLMDHGAETRIAGGLALAVGLVTKLRQMRGSGREQFGREGVYRRIARNRKLCGCECRPIHAGPTAQR